MSSEEYGFGPEMDAIIKEAARDSDKWQEDQKNKKSIADFMDKAFDVEEDQSHLGSEVKINHKEKW